MILPRNAELESWEGKWYFVHLDDVRSKIGIQMQWSPMPISTTEVDNSALKPLPEL